MNKIEMFWLLILITQIISWLLFLILWKTIGMGSLDKETRKRISKQKGFIRE